MTILYLLQIALIYSKVICKISHFKLPIFVPNWDLNKWGYNLITTTPLSGTVALKDCEHDNWLCIIHNEKMPKMFYSSVAYYNIYIKTKTNKI